MRTFPLTTSAHFDQVVADFHTLDQEASRSSQIPKFKIPGSTPFAQIPKSTLLLPPASPDRLHNASRWFAAVQEQGMAFETRSLPALTRSYPRHFTFHVAHPIRSIQTRSPPVLLAPTLVTSASPARTFYAARPLRSIFTSYFFSRPAKF